MPSVGLSGRRSTLRSSLAARGRASTRVAACRPRGRPESSFFFSSRRRHTRWPRDWSSDVCSSDLLPELSHPDRDDARALVPARGHREAALWGRHARVDDRDLHRVRLGLPRPHDRGHVHARHGHEPLPALGCAIDASVLRAGPAVIRPHTDTTTTGLIGRIKRRQLLRAGFLTGTLLATLELTAIVVPFFRVNKITGLGAKIGVGPKADILARFKSA